MPLPKPRKGEQHDDFIGRCASAIADEFPDNDQRVAVCQSQWEKKQKQSEAGKWKREYHLATIRELSDFDESTLRFKTLPKSENGKGGVRMQFGKQKGKVAESDPTITQSYRFPAALYTEGEAKQWLDDNGEKPIRFELAQTEEKEGYAMPQTFTFNSGATDNEPPEGTVAVNSGEHLLNPPDDHETEWLRVGQTGRPIEVDREANVIRGMVLAQEGPFKTAGRGEFDAKAIRQIVKMIKDDHPDGLKSRFAHPTESDDGIGKLLGRIKHPFVSKMEKNGGEIAVARGDLHFNPTALEEPVGGGRPLGDYVMALCESDPDVMASSLVIEPDKQYRIDKQNRPMLDEEGDQLPPLWYPIRLHACDIVDTGEAVDGLLSAEMLDGLPNSVVFRGVELLDKQFAGKTREFVRERLLHFAERYLTRRYGEASPAVKAHLQAHRRALGLEEQAYNPEADPEIRRRRLKNRG